jgi:hypothetical protein
MESQYAYQGGRSTEAALHDLVQNIEGSLHQKEFTLGVFLDIDGAFDNASLQFFICVVHIKPNLWPACGVFKNLRICIK